MTPEQWRRVKRVFHRALEQREDARALWLDRACGSDVVLRQEVESLLKAHGTADGFLTEAAAIDPDDGQTEPERSLDMDGPGDAALAPGMRIGSFEIVRELGRGGMGIVYLAEDRRLGRRVALKALPPAVVRRADLRERLRREARAAATIAHPAVAVVHALEEHDDQLFIVSEYVQGHTLRREIEEGPLPPARALAIVADIARALQAAHEAAVVHRDLKPENVLITDAGGVKVVDFGVALVGGADGAPLTRTGVVLGTPAYMAPEQLIGSDVDARADLYAVGVVLTEMLTGRHPSRQNGAATDALPPDVAPIVTRCLQLAPHARYGSARELLDALERVRAAQGHGGRQGRGLRSGGRLSPRWWWECHQGTVALIYWLMVVPAWSAGSVIGGPLGRVAFFITLAAVIVAANLRFHLWFTSRFYPVELRWVRARSGRRIRTADWVLAVALVGSGVGVLDRSAPLGVALISFGIGAAVAFLFIEPVTARAAFRGTLEHSRASPLS